MSEVEATDIVQMMREKSRGDLNSPFWNVCADEMQNLRAERDRLQEQSNAQARIGIGQEQTILDLLAERDALSEQCQDIRAQRNAAQAEHSALMQRYAIESDESLTECVDRTVRGWQSKCDALAGELAATIAHADNVNATHRVTLREVGVELARTTEQRDRLAEQLAQARAVLREAADTLAKCRYSEVPMAVKCYRALGVHSNELGFFGVYMLRPLLHRDHNHELD